MEKKNIKELEIDWHFIMHSIAIACGSFIKAEETIEILKKEGIFKKKGRK